MLDRRPARLARELARTQSRVGQTSLVQPRSGQLNVPKAAPQSYWMCIPEIARAITSCWISAVPSKMS
jgi:hypothetical protein